MAKARLTILVNASSVELDNDSELAALTVPASHEWRLSSGNGRELGRSARTFSDADACRRDLLALQMRVTEASVLIGSAGGGGCWTWRLQLGPDGPAAVGGRRYARRRECRYNLDRFTEALAELEPPSDLCGFTFRRLVSTSLLDLTDGASAKASPTAAGPALTWNGGQVGGNGAGAVPVADLCGAHEGRLGSQAPALHASVSLDQMTLPAVAGRADRALRTRPVRAPLTERPVQPLAVAPAARLAWQPAPRLAGFR